MSFLTKLFSKTQRSDSHALQYNSLLAQYHFNTNDAVFLAWRRNWPHQHRFKIHRQDPTDFRLTLHWDHSPHPFILQIISTFPISRLKMLSLFAPVDREILLATFGNLSG
ncbi:hypothetical protein CPB83DRAFT_456301 [Crepidotus variabilis]|uniref:Uncharacterized protein n=1 Tax=Crepidotus variabilis TaxID=179855 RepID=A0A9P6JN10_9AGAR|nr:hypothetical protein CPB83DRAFT_456301 [Crepidotus variabilis]